MRKKLSIKPWMGSFGVLGFMGFLYFIFKESFMLIFFGFFGFFSFYWDGKLETELSDERLRENQQRASKIGISVGYTITFISMILIGNYWGKRDPVIAYNLLNAIISISFAISLNLSSYLAYKFDKGE